MIAQAIVALLQQASEIDRANVRSCFLYRTAADNFFTGFRRLHIPRRGAVGGNPSFLPQTLAALSADFFWRHGQRARQAKKYLKGGPAARRGL
jgi:hypothetical protein